MNPVDWKFRAGYLADYIPLQLPAIPGNDAAGVVDELGAGVLDVAVGDRVFGTCVQGSTAELAVLSAWAGIPETLTSEQAAGAGFAGVVAVCALDMLDVRPGQTLLIEGAAGGVGSIAAQIGVARGLTVIGTAGEANHDYLRSLGAIPVAYGAGLVERMAELAPNGVDGVLDTAGSGSLADLILLAGDAGRVVSLADFAAPAAGARLVDGWSGEPSAALREVAALAAAGQLTVHVTEVFPLEQIAAAHELSQSHHVRGKIVVSL